MSETYASEVYLRVLNNPKWPLRKLFISLLQRYIHCCERRRAIANEW